MKSKADKFIFKIQSYDNRMKIVSAFADEGYSVRCFEKDSKERCMDSDYFVEIEK